MYRFGTRFVIRKPFKKRQMKHNNTMSRLLLTIDSLNSKKNGEEPHRIVELCTKDLMEHGIEKD